MQFLLQAVDGTDPDAGARRMAVRPAHIALGDEMVASGEKLYGVALLDDAGNMAGSVAVLDLPTRDAVDAYLAREPYVVGNVWTSIGVRQCQRRPAPLPPFRPSTLSPDVRTQTIVTALDHPGAQARRAEVRADHLALSDEMVARSELLYAVAILDDEGAMVGSMMIVDFATPDGLRAWLDREPYVVARVWNSIDIRPCRVGPSQRHLHRSDGPPTVR